jgi:hypothetical protein
MGSQAIEIMGPEYVLMLGVWWGVAVVLTVAFLAAKRAIVNRRKRQADSRESFPAARGSLER